MQQPVKKEERVPQQRARFYRADSISYLKITPKEKILRYKQLVSSDQYIDYAIRKIATDLTHFLTK